MEWMLMPLKRYAEFSGRSRRKEYWMFVLFTVLVNLAFVTLMVMAGGATMFAAMSGENPDPTAMLAATGAVGIVYLISMLFSLAILIPSVAVGVRRLHDTGRTGWWLLGPVVPYLAMIVTSVGLLGTMSASGPNDGAAATAGIVVLLGGLAAFVLGITVFVFMCLEGTRGPNRFGPDPKNTDGSYEEVFG